MEEVVGGLCPFLIKVQKLSFKFQPLQECTRGSSIGWRWKLCVVTSSGWVRLLGFRVGFSDHP